MPRGRPPKVTQEQIDRMRLLRSFHWTVERIAKEMGLTPPTVSKYTDDVLPKLEDKKNHGKPNLFK